MRLEDKIRDEKLKYNINREAPKIIISIIIKIYKYKYFASKEILLLHQSRKIE